MRSQCGTGVSIFGSMTNFIKDADRTRYRDEGFMVLKNVIPGDVLQMLREECSYFLGYYDSIMDAKGVTTEGISHRGKRYFVSNRYRLSSRLWEFIFSPLMAEVVKATVGPTACLFHEQWVVKGAEQGMKFSWHQDSGYVKWYDPTTRHLPTSPAGAPWTTSVKQTAPCTSCRTRGRGRGTGSSIMSRKRAPTTWSGTRGATQETR